MAILNPEHLLEQADALIVPPPAGPPRQVNVRRAISAAYYAVFHAVVTAAADQFVGVTLRATKEYGLVARSINHSLIKATCADLSKSTIPAKYLPYLPANAFGPDLATLLATFPDLQEQRHTADYDPLVRLKTIDAKSIIATARTVILQFNSSPALERKSFLFLLLFPPKR